MKLIIDQKIYDVTTFLSPDLNSMELSMSLPYNRDLFDLYNSYVNNRIKPKSQIVKDFIFFDFKTEDGIILYNTIITTINTVYNSDNSIDMNIIIIFDSYNLDINTKKLHKIYRKKKIERLIS